MSVDQKLKAAATKLKKLVDAPIEPGTHKQTAGRIQELRDDIDALLDEKLAALDEVTLELEAAFSAS